MQPDNNTAFKVTNMPPLSPKKKMAVSLLGFGLVIILMLLIVFFFS
ncbi:hypothetical protein BH10PAT2_BH10PAT2_2590 [soil metagenome]